MGSFVLHLCLDAGDGLIVTPAVRSLSRMQLLLGITKIRSHEGRKVTKVKRFAGDDLPTAD